MRSEYIHESSGDIANLMEESQIAPLASADFIFCRNVFIYFSENTIGRVGSFLCQVYPASWLFVCWRRRIAVKTDVGFYAERN